MRFGPSLHRQSSVGVEHSDSKASAQAAGCGARRGAAVAASPYPRYERCVLSPCSPSLYQGRRADCAASAMHWQHGRSRDAKRHLEAPAKYIAFTCTATGTAVEQTTSLSVLSLTDAAAARSASVPASRRPVDDDMWTAMGAPGLAESPSRPRRESLKTPSRAESRVALIKTESLLIKKTESLLI